MKASASFTSGVLSFIPATPYVVELVSNVAECTLMIGGIKGGAKGAVGQGAKFEGVIFPKADQGVLNFVKLLSHPEIKECPDIHCFYVLPPHSSHKRSIPF